MSKRIKCPKWGCNGIGIPIDIKKKFSVSKSLVNGAVGAMFNPVGMVVGGATGINGKSGKTTFVCSVCGRTWTGKV